MSNSRIEELIDEIESFIDNCKYQPLSNTKIIVNKEEIDELLRELRNKTPDEIKRYQKIISNKEAILNDAKQRAQELIDKTTAQTSQLVSESQIMRDAYEQANSLVAEAARKAQEILSHATEEANQMKSAAVAYTDQLLKDVEQVVNRSIDVVNQHNDAILTELTSYSELLKQNRSDLKPPETISSPRISSISSLQTMPPVQIPEAGGTASDSAAPSGNGEISLDML